MPVLWLFSHEIILRENRRTLFLWNHSHMWINILVFNLIFLVWYSRITPNTFIQTTSVSRLLMPLKIFFYITLFSWENIINTDPFQDKVVSEKNLRLNTINVFLWHAMLSTSCPHIKGFVSPTLQGLPLTTSATKIDQESKDGERVVTSLWESKF